MWKLKKKETKNQRGSREVGVSFFRARACVERLVLCWTNGFVYTQPIKPRQDLFSSHGSAQSSTEPGSTLAIVKGGLTVAL